MSNPNLIYGYNGYANVYMSAEAIQSYENRLNAMSKTIEVLKEKIDDPNSDKVKAFRAHRDDITNMFNNFNNDICEKMNEIEDLIATWS